MTLRYAIIGSGMMGCEHIRNLGLIEGAQVTAICDRSEAMRDKAIATARECGFDAVTSFEDHAALLKAGGIDAVVVATPNDTHHAIMEDLSGTDLPVLLEKPSATSPDHARSLVDRFSGRAAPVWVAMEYRYMPPVARLIEAVRAGEAGAVKMLSIVEHRFPFLEKPELWNRSTARTGGTLIEKCCHFFDLMRLITGSEPQRIFASGAQDVNFLQPDETGAAADMIDNAFVICDFANGMRASLDLCMFAEGSWWQEQVCVTGDAGQVAAHVPGPSRFWPGGEERASEVVISPRADKAPLRQEVHVDETILAAGDHHGGTYYQHQRFFRLVTEGGEPEVTLHDGARAVEMGAAAQRSIETGQPVMFQPGLS